MRMTESIHWIACGYVGPYFTANNDCNVYLLKGPDGYILVDAGCGDEVELIEQQLKWDQVNVEDINAILMTHTHIDHAGGLPYWKERTGATIYASEAAAEHLKVGGEYHPGKPGESIISACPADVIIADGENLSICGLPIKGISAPGHCSNMMCFMTELDGRKVLVSADSIYWGGKLTIFYFPDADRNIFKKTLQRLDQEEFDAFLPGHRYPVFSGGKEHLKLGLEEIDRQLAGEPAMRG